MESLCLDGAVAVILQSNKALHRIIREYLNAGCELVDREFMAPYSQECKDRTPARLLLPDSEVMEV